jgi:DNA-binding HxlR family transcriptional regulator
MIGIRSKHQAVSAVQPLFRRTAETPRLGVSQKMLIQQLRDLERDGIVQRTVYPQVPPKVEYRLTDWGQAMCPALDALLEWAAARPPARP